MGAFALLSLSACNCAGPLQSKKSQKDGKPPSGSGASGGSVSTSVSSSPSPSPSASGSDSPSPSASPTPSPSPTPTPSPVPLTVSPLYGANGDDWNEYVKTADTTQACDPTVNGYALCIHGGEKKQVAVAGVSSCSGLTMTDALGVFQWTCDDSSGTATFYSSGFQSGKGLKDLLNATSWKNNSVTLSGTSTGSSTAGAWWSNPVKALPDNSSGSYTKLDGTDDDGAGTADVSLSQGDILTVASSRVTPGYWLAMDRLALVTLPGATLTFKSGTANNCFASAEKCLLWSEGGYKYLWIEASLDGNAVADGDAELEDIRFSRIHQSRFTNSNANAENIWIGGSGSKNNTVTYLTVTNSAHSGAYIQGTYSFYDHLTATGNALYGVMINGATNNAFSNILADGNRRGVQLTNGADNNTINDVVIKNSNENGIFIQDSNGTVLRRLIASNSATTGWGVGLTLSNASNGKYFDVTIVGASRGLQVYNNSTGNLISRVVSSHSKNGQGLYLFNNDTSNNVYTQILTHNNSIDGILLENDSGSYFSQVTTIGNTYVGINFDNSSSHVFNQVITANNGTSGLGFSSATSNNTFGQLIATDNDTYGIDFGNFSSGTKITGNLMIGSNDTSDCRVTGGTNPGLSAACASTDASNFARQTGKSLASSFVGALGAADSVNASDDGSLNPGYPASAAAEALFDWFGFENFFRGWGLDGTFANNRGNWSSGSGHIWDYRLKSTDTTALEKSDDGASSNNRAFTIGGNCPAAVDGNKSATNKAGTITYLLNAVEIVDSQATGYSATGNHNGLCENNESCMYMPNYGAYQGHGTIGTCSFANGTVTGVTMYGYVSNGI